MQRYYIILVVSLESRDRHRIPVNTVTTTKRYNNMNKKYPTVEIFPKSNRKIVERGNIDITYTQK
jgi:hypothetical protein